jgi:O-antigen/teichoic acid export membrane protein
MTRAAIILRNVASNWVGFGLNAAVTLVLTPFVLRQLGSAGYGVWVLTSSVIGYYGLLDLGFRAGVTQYLTRYLAIGDNRKASECLSSAVAVLASLGVLMLGLSILAGLLAPRLFHLPRGMEHDAFWCILIVGCSAAIQLALNPFTSVFTATQRFDLANAIGVATRLMTAVGITASLLAGQGLVGVSLATCAASAVDYVIRWRVARRLAPGLEFSLRHASMTSVREIGAFGAWNFVASLNTFVYQHGPNIIIGATMPIAAVGRYALATGLTRQLNSVLTPVPQVLYPAATELHVREDREGLERLYHDGSRLMLLVLTAVLVPAAFYAPDFYRTWIGSAYVSGSWNGSVATIFQILVISVFADFSSGVGGQVLIAAGHVRPLAFALIAGSIINLSGSLILIPQFGLAGIAMGTVMGALVVDFVLVPVLLQRYVGLSIVLLIRRAWPRPLVAAAALAVLLGALRLGVGRPDGWTQLIGFGLASGAAAAAVVLAVGVTADERRRFLIAPLRRLTGTIDRAEAAA